MSLYGASNTGRPYSFGYDGTIVPYGFTPYLDFRTTVLEPGAKRSAETGSSWTKIDFRIEQELPGFRQSDRASAFLVIDNLTNLFNDDWGVLYQTAFPRTVEIGTEPKSRIGDASRYEVRIGVQYRF